jgi:DNA helicase-2/ATP-dependent DNA helicase PcrA
VLSYAETRRIHGMETYGSPSRFLREIPSQLLHEVRPKVQVSRTMYNNSGRRDGGGLNRGHAAIEAPPVKLGAQVRHASFGTGTVTDYEGSGAHARVQVNFDDVGSKWLVLAYANLVPA